jgi:protein SCO1/2
LPARGGPLSLADMRRLLPTALIIAGALLVSAATWSVFRHGVVSTETGLPALGRVPDFSLVDSHGQPLSQAQLSGGVWVADFIFTHCPGVCPTLSAQMAKLQHTLPQVGGEPVRLVSFSVDPANDTPEVLRAYAERFGAEQGRWLFVTGERDALYTLIGKGFHLAVADRPEGANTDGEGLITHSDRFVLIDPDLQIRGYYHGTDPESVQKLLRDLKQLKSDSVSVKR